MNLPKIEQPLFPIKIPSLDKEVLFRPFLVKEEKILLIANTSKEERDIILAIKQIITNCMQDESVSVSKLTTFDLEYIFLKLRARSVNNLIEFRYTDMADNRQYDITVNLDEVELETPEKPAEKVVMIDEKKGFGLRLKYPSVDDTVYYKEPGLTPDQMLARVIETCIEDVFTNDDVYQLDQSTPEQRAEFVDSIPVPVFTKIQEFFDSMPVLRHTVEYKTKDGEKKTILFEGLNDFFTWG